MRNALNRLIAETLGIEHIYMQEGPYKDREADFGHSKWITILDGDEIFGEAFPKDWEHDLNAAWPLINEMPFHTGFHLQARLDHRPAVAAYQICTAWLQWKGVDIEQR